MGQHGLSFNGSYTYAKSIDNGGQEYTSNEFAGSISNPWPFVTDLQRGPSDFDVKHNVNLNFVYDIPAPHFDFAPANFITSGWELTGIFSARTGLPFTIGIPNDQAATGGFISNGVHVAQRPDFNPSAVGCNATSPQGAVNSSNRDTYLNLACFPYPAAGTLGNLPRNALRGLPLNNLDFSIFKNTKLFQEKLNVQFRAEFFNILNQDRCRRAGREWMIIKRNILVISVKRDFGIRDRKKNDGPRVCLCEIYRHFENMATRVKGQYRCHKILSCHGFQRVRRESVIIIYEQGIVVE